MTTKATVSKAPGDRSQPLMPEVLGARPGRTKSAHAAERGAQSQGALIASPHHHKPTTQVSTVIHHRADQAARVSHSRSDGPKP